MLVEQIRSVDADHVRGEPVDFLTPEDMAEVEFAVARYLGIDSLMNM